jgi:WD40 repeat protein
VAFNPSGSRLLETSRDRTASIFNTATWEVETTYRGHGSPLLAGAFFPDGSRVLTVARGRGHVWHPEKIDKHTDLEELSGEVRQLVTGPFGIAAGCADGAIRIYQAGERQPWLALHGHRDAVQSLAVSPKVDWIASGSSDGEVIVWSLLCDSPLNRFSATPR